MVLAVVIFPLLGGDSSTFDEVVVILVELWHYALGDVPAVVLECHNGSIVNPGDYEKFGERLGEISTLSKEKKKVYQE